MKEAWTKRGVELGKLEAKMDGKFLMVVVGSNWPTIKIGPSGGGDIPALKSYAKFFDAAVVADELFKKQQERAAKKTAQSTPAPKPDTTKAAEQPKETVTSKKQKAHEQLEQKLATA